MRASAIVLLLLTGCNGAFSPPLGDVAERKVRVVATTGMIADAIRHVGGDRVQVEALMGPGVDPHLYKATPGDTAKLQSADVIFYNGLHLEGKMADVLEQLGGRKVCVAVTRRFDPSRDLRPAPKGFEGSHDPHVWFDVSLWTKAVDEVRETLTRADPTHADGYKQRASVYVGQLNRLHEEVKAKATSIPAERRLLVTAHDAFYYFGRAYGFEVHGLQGVSTADEANPRDVQALAELIGKRHVPAIFGETSVPDRNLQAVVNAAALDFGHKVRFIPGELYSDALGNPGTPAGNYVGMVRHNIDVIAGALK